MSVHLRTKWSWVRITLLLLKTPNIAPASNKELLDIQANYRVWIHSETRTWHDNNMQSIDCFFCDENFGPKWINHCMKNEVFHQGFLQQTWPNPHFSADLVTFTEEILNGKLRCLCSQRLKSQTCFICSSILLVLLFFS